MAEIAAAAGDDAARPAKHGAWQVVENAVFGGERRLSELVVPRCTYTTPEVAAVGRDEAGLVADGVAFDAWTSDLQVTSHATPRHVLARSPRTAGGPRARAPCRSTSTARS